MAVSIGMLASSKTVVTSAIERASSHGGVVAGSAVEVASNDGCVIANGGVARPSGHCGIIAAGRAGRASSHHRIVAVRNIATPSTYSREGILTAGYVSAAACHGGSGTACSVEIASPHSTKAAADCVYEVFIANAFCTTAGNCRSRSPRPNHRIATVAPDDIRTKTESGLTIRCWFDTECTIPHDPDFQRTVVGRT